MSEKQKYYLGLDCGTSSVGWAVTDEKYNLLRRKGKTLWGMRLFDEAKTAADRRIARSNRRRLARAKSRIKLLQMLFREEMVKVDPSFYTRLRESFYLEEDKNFADPTANSKNTLFNDADFKDKDYHKEYPTIWHLRNAIISAPENKHFDLRLYYLAIEHIIKHRGHFLKEGALKGAGDFDELWDSFCGYANDSGFAVLTGYKKNAEALLKKKMSKTDKKKQLGNEMFDVADEDFVGDQKDLAALLCGSKISLKKLFGIESEEDYKLSFAEGVFEDKIPEIEDYLADIENGIDLIMSAKQIYDYIYLSDLLRGSDNVSAAMVRNYNQHQEDLREIKATLKPFEKDYKYFFKTEEMRKEGEVFYAAYVGKAYSQDKKGRRKSYSVSQEDINKELAKLFKAHGIVGDLLSRAEEGVLLPKQRGFAKGTIPQQLHHNELKVILDRLARDYPSFAREVAGESDDYNTALKKIEKIHDFRIPYYCGPMLSRSEKKTTFSWADSEIKEIVRPWNYDELIDKSARADKFIARMTNECTYVVGADVLPKNSFAYQKYMVLNELNNLKINGVRIDNETKQKIYEKGYKSGELNGNSISLKRLKKWMHSTGILKDGDELSGTNEAKVLPKLSTNADFARILGADYSKKYSSKSLEKIVELITILNNERKMLAEKIKEELKCDDEQASKLAKLNYKDWGKFSEKFLTGVVVEIGGRRMSILDALWETPHNLMELLGGEFEFKNELDRINHASIKEQSEDITYGMVKELYCSPAVKRTVWQAIKIVQEIKEVMGYAPEKIFLEVTRGEEKGEKKIKLARRKDLIEKYKQIKTQEAKDLLSGLDKECDDRDLQSKKLFLYYCQMGKCAYCGEHIDLEEINNNQLYDIDHIYPRSRTKDDSITRNLVLVHAKENREKTNHYPIEDDIRSKMHGIWGSWCHSGLITKEKYERLTRATPLTDDELAGFISRQIVETSQSVKAIRDLIQQHMSDTKVVMVKAGSVSDLRHFYGYSGDKLNNLDVMPEFIKIRELNDIHHAKDAYLNIIVGNVINSTFTDNPYEWVKRKKDSNYNYSIRTERLFRNSEKYKLASNVVTDMPEVKAWDYAESVKTISDTMKRNDVLWTKMVLEQARDGAIAKATIVGKHESSEGILPIKKSINPKKYGGYTGVQGAYFALIETKDKKDNLIRKIVQIPLLAKERVDKYLEENYPDSTIIIRKIPINSLLKINGVPLTISGKTGASIIFASSIQLKISVNNNVYMKRISAVVNKIKNNKKYEIDIEKDKITKEENLEFFDMLLERLEACEGLPYLGGFVGRAKANREAFRDLSIERQCEAIVNLITAFSCNTTTSDLSIFIPRGNNVGKCLMSSDISKMQSCILLRPSMTGLFEKKPIDLLTVQPGEI